MAEVGATSTSTEIGATSTEQADAPVLQVKRAELIAEYESLCSSALWAARIVGALHSLCHFLTLCIVTWATVVLLGAFVASLQFLDYTMVSSLLLLEAFGLASGAVLFTQFLTRALTYRPHAIQVRLLSCFLQALLLFPSFIAPALRLPKIKYEIHSDLHNLQNSLRIFYILVFANAFISLIRLGCSCKAYICLSDSSEQSILRYYDHVLLNALQFGIVQADDFDFFDFAYQMLGSYYARQVKPEAVVRSHKKLLEYLYLHRQGVDNLQIYLDASDASVREAAASMVGIWADVKWGSDEKTGLKLPGELLTKLVDRVGTGQVGRAACNSLGSLARRYPELIIKSVTNSGKTLSDVLVVDGSSSRVLDVLAEVVCVEGSSSCSRSLTSVRTLVIFYNNLYVKEKPPVLPGKIEEMVAKWPLPEKIEEMVAELKKLLSGSKVMRLRVLSAYLLNLLGKLDHPESDIPLIKRICPTEHDVFFKSEVEMLHSFYENPPPFPGKFDEDKDVKLKFHPPWIINTPSPPSCL